METVPRRGYRFIAPLNNVPANRPIPPLRTGQKKRWPLIWAFGAVALGGMGLMTWRLFSVPVASPINSLAVLPLANLSGDPGQEYFVDGMTDELTTTIGQIQALRVISRSSVMPYKSVRPQGGVRAIAQQLNVDAVVEGSVLRSGDRIRITAQLIDARTDRHLWSQSYEREMRDVLDLQGGVARDVADAVQAKLTPDAEERLARTRAVDPEAHELYLKGEDLYVRTEARKALEYFQNAVQRDPNFARAYLGIAKAYGSLGDSDELASSKAYSQQKAYALKALELDPSLDEAHVNLARALRSGDWDWEGCERELKRALEINHNSAIALVEYSFDLPLVGRTEEALAGAHRFQEIEPNSSRSHRMLGWVYYFSGRYDEALIEFRKAIEIGGPNPWNELFFAWAYLEKDMTNEAIAEFRKIPTNILPSPAFIGHMGDAYARAGNKAEARRIIRVLSERSAKEEIGTYEVAFLYGRLGDKDRAFEWLEKAYRVHDKGMTFLKVDHALDPLRSDPRFQTYLDRMHFPT